MNSPRDPTPAWELRVAAARAARAKHRTRTPKKMRTVLAEYRRRKARMVERARREVGYSHCPKCLQPYPAPDGTPCSCAASQR